MAEGTDLRKVRVESSYPDGRNRIEREGPSQIERHDDSTWSGKTKALTPVYICREP